ncbi:MAG TPA: FG-GAP-like repeat-containing protein, partial [Vicinamibacteria bacterium]|nr:FG-GAP-like repeat-containing protein [Vicinamibacteria bacterium]
MTPRQRFLIGLALAVAATLAVPRLEVPHLLAAAPAPDAKGQALARVACVACHKVPAPDILPRAAWAREIEKMALILAGKGMPEWGDTAPRVALSDEYKAVLAYYEAAAPAALPPLPPWPAPAERPLRFVRRPIAFKEALTPEPAVANVRLADLDGDGRPELLACDMRQGVVLRARPDRPGEGAAVIAQVPHPDHIAVVDFDGDGGRDLLVADLGEFFPGDHEKGAVTGLRAQPGGGYAPFTIGGFPRVADAEALVPAGG